MGSKPRILIIDRAGQVGVELQRSFRELGEVVAVGWETANLAEADTMRHLVRRVKPDIALNAAAYTAVDWAELKPSLAMTINARAVRTLAEEAQRTDALPVQYSTDYVFDGQKQSPWTEIDEANPLNSYGASKLVGEEAIKQAGGKYLVFLTSWVYGPRGSNFVADYVKPSQGTLSDLRHTRSVWIADNVNRACRCHA
jgi:dTDP-4-dehydrorhamnose reductase